MGEDRGQSISPTGGTAASGQVPQETTLRLDARTFVEPDFCVFPRDLPLSALDGPAVLLAIEIADSSLAYDKGRKIGVYAAFGVREVWVVDAVRAVTHRPSPAGRTGYAEIVALAPAQRASSPCSRPSSHLASPSSA